MNAALRSVPPEAPAAADVTLHAADGFPLAARLFRPAGEPRGAVLMVPAMGVSQAFYAALAGWLADEGFVVLTFDYRGTGGSRRGPLRELEADILVWAERDTAAALRFLGEHAPGLPINWIGHSLGGQIVPFVPGHEAAAKLVTIATGSGYWLTNAPPLKRKVWLLWWFVAPVATTLFGYFPGSALGMVGDLPRGVIRQWRRWCLDREYAVGVEGAHRRFAAVETPLTSLSFTDDELMSAEGIGSIHDFYSGARQRRVRIDPKQVGVRRLGHFGFFRSEQRRLWEELLRPELVSASPYPG